MRTVEYTISSDDGKPPRAKQKIALRSPLVDPTDTGGTSCLKAILPIAGDAMLPTTGDDVLGEHDEFSDRASTVPDEDAPLEAETLPYEDEEAHDNVTLAWWKPVTLLTSHELCTYHCALTIWNTKTK